MITIMIRKKLSILKESLTILLRLMNLRSTTTLVALISQRRTTCSIFTLLDLPITLKKRNSTPIPNRRLKNLNPSKLSLKSQMPLLFMIRKMASISLLRLLPTKDMTSPNLTKVTIRLKRKLTLTVLM